MVSTHGRACQPSRDQLVHEKQNCIIGDDVAGRCALNVSRAGLCPYAHHADCSEKIARSFWFGSCVGNRLQASRLGKAWRVLDAATSHADKEDGVSPCAGAMWLRHTRAAFSRWQHEQQTATQSSHETAAQSSSHETAPHAPRRICEIGLNAGKSALMWLCAFPSAEYHAFDHFGHNASRVAAAILRMGFPGRFHAHAGDTRTTLPALSRRSGGSTSYGSTSSASLGCDVISIDGGHDVETATSDLALMARHAARPHHVLLMDDLRCPWWVCNAPTKVWRQAADAKLIRETGCWIAGRYGGWCAGEYR